jgi:predicted DNA-binding WGR domain protein
VAIDANRFYAVSVKDSRQVAALLKQGDEFVRAFNRLRLKDGKLNLKSFLPKEDKSAAVEDSKPAPAVEDSKSPAVEVPSAVEDSPRLAVAKAIASLTKLLPLLEGKDKDDALSALAKLIG